MNRCQFSPVANVPDPDGLTSLSKGSGAEIEVRESSAASHTIDISYSICVPVDDENSHVRGWAWCLVRMRHSDACVPLGWSGLRCCNIRARVDVND